MPAGLGDPMHDAIEFVDIADSAEALKKRETATANAALVEALHLPVRHLVADIGDPLVSAAALRDRVRHHPVIGTMNGRIDDDTTLGTDFFMQRSKRSQWSLRRVVGPVGRKGVTAGRAEDTRV